VVLYIGELGSPKSMLREGYQNMKTIRDLRTLLPWDCFPINNLVFQIIKGTLEPKRKNS
jgi:hypothetical protein